MSAFFNRADVRGVVLLSVFVMVLLALSWLLSPVMVPLLGAFVLYGLLDPFISTLIRKGLNLSQALTLVFILLVVSILFGLFIVMPILMEQFAQFQQSVPIMWETTVNMISQFEVGLEAKLGIDLDAQALAQPLIDGAKGWGQEAVFTFGRALAQVASALVLVPMFTFFLFRDFRKMRNRILDWLPNQNFELGCLIYFQVTDRLQRYIRGVLIQSCVVALVTTIGFALFGFGSPGLLGVLAGLLNVIPYVGPLLSMVPPVFLTTGFDIGQLSLILAVVGMAQLIDNVIVIPAVIAQAVDLHPLIILIGLIVFGSFFGFIGILLAIPIMSVIRIVFTGLYKGLHGRREPYHERNISLFPDGENA